MAAGTRPLRRKVNSQGEMGTPRWLTALRSRDGPRSGCVQSDATYSDGENDEKECIWARGDVIIARSVDREWVVGLVLG
jgi:hypothetical protein